MPRGGLNQSVKNTKKFILSSRGETPRILVRNTRFGSWHETCCYIGMNERIKPAEPSKVQESTQKIEDDFSDMMPTSEEFWADAMPEPYEPSPYDGTYSEM